MNKVRHAIGAILAAASGIVYLATMSDVIIPGEPTRSIYVFLELIPRTSPANPLWTALAWFVKAVPVEHAMMAGTVLSALFGALTVWLVYLIVSGVIAAIAMSDDGNRKNAVFVGVLGGAAAASFLAVSTPFWMVSTRIHPGSFHLFLLSVCALLLLRYATTGKLIYLCLLGSAYGATMAEVASAILFMPALAVGLIYLMWRHNQLRATHVALFLIAGLLGCLVYLLSAWSFYTSDGYELRGYGSFEHIFRVILTDQFGLIAGDLPQHGWLLALVLTVVPWLTILFSAWRSVNDDRDWSLCAINLVMTCCCLLLLFNVRFSSWGLLGFNRMLVAPHFLAALTFGVLFSYWLLLCRPCPEDVEVKCGSLLRTVGAAMSAVLVGSLLVAFFLTGSLVRREETDISGMLAETLVSDVASLPAVQNGDPVYLVSYGLLDPYIILKSRERGLNLRILSAVDGDRELYLRYVRTLVDQPALKRVADAGIMPLVNEMLMDKQGLRERVLVQWPVALITGAGYEAVPHKLFYIAQQGKSGLDPKDLLDEHIAFWNRMLPAMSDASGRSEASSRVNKALAGQMAVIANDLGMLLEDLGDMDRAHTAYRMSRLIDGRNMSALANLMRMARDGLSDDSYEELEAELRTQRGTQVLYELASGQGGVRNSQYYFNRGLQYGRSGQTELAEMALRKALGGSGGSNEAVVAVLANACLMNNYAVGGKEMFAGLLKENPQSTMALVGLARVAIAEGDLSQAKRMLAEAKKTVDADDAFSLDEAMIAVLAGETDSAIAILQESTQNYPSREGNWILLIDLVAQYRTVEQVEELIAGMRMSGGRFPRVYAGARLAILKQDWPNARRHLEEARSIHPENLLLREELLRVCVAAADKDSASAHVKGILLADSGHALANYVLGSLQYARNNAEGAEASFRKSLERERSHHALNDLAWVLKEKGELDEAEKLAREATEQRGELHSAWDTLGMILLAKGELNEAEKMLGKSYDLSKKRPQIGLHYAEALVKNGEMSGAVAVVADVEANKTQLSDDDRKKLKELLKRLK